MLLVSCFTDFAQNFNPWVFLFLAGLGRIDGAGSSVFVMSIGRHMKQPACSIGEHSKSQNFRSRVRKICMVVDTHQDIIGYDAPVISRILPD